MPLYCCVPGCKVKRGGNRFPKEEICYMVEVMKSGYVQRHSKSFLDGGWRKVWLALYKDSTLVIFKKQGDASPKGSIFLKEVCKWFAVGQYTDGMPERPSMPSGGKVDYLIGIPQKPSSKSKIHWFLCSCETELHEWMAAICSTLPPPPQQNPQRAPPQQASPHHQSTASRVSVPYPSGHPYPPPAPGGSPQPPPPYSAMPQPGPVGFGAMAGALPQVPPPAAYPQQPYPQQPYQQQPPYQQQQAYAQQGYPAQPYPQQGYYQAQPGYHGAAPPPGQYPYPQGRQPPPQGYYQQQQPHVEQGHQKKKGGIMGSNAGKMAVGLIGGAAVGYGMKRMIGGGMGGGFGMGRWGSWSSMSSCGSFGSFGSGCS